MANGKKIYTIQINGVTEASKSVDALYEKLTNLNKALAEMKKVDIPITIGGDEQENIKTQINDIKREIDSLKETVKDIDLGSEKYQEASERLNDLSRSVNKVNNEIRRNKLDKLKDSLKDTSKEAEKMKEAFDEVEKKFDSLKGVRIDETSVKRYGLSLDDLKWKINQLDKAIQGMNIGSDEWKETNRELLDLKQTLKMVESEMEAAVRAEDQLNTKIKMNINGLSLTFDDANQAIGVLEDKMFALGVAGKQDTKEFKELADTISRLKNQVKSVTNEIDAMSEGGKGINKALSITQGFTSVITGAQGIANLFGGGEDMTRTIATMTSLMGVLQSVQSIKQQMSQNDDFGQMLTRWGVLFNTLFKPLNSLNKALSNLGETYKQILNNDKDKLFDNLTKGLDNVKNLIDDIKNDAGRLKLNIAPDDSQLQILKKLRNEWETLMYNQHQGTISQEDSDRLSELEQYMERIRQLTPTLVAVSKETYTASDAWKLFKEQMAQSWKNIKEGTQSLLGLGKTTKSTTLGFNLMATSIKTATVAVKALTMVLKASVILLVVEALMKLVDITTQWVTKQYEAIKGNDKLVNSLDVVKSRLDATAISIERFNKEIDKLKDMGQLNEVDALSKKMEFLEAQTNKAVKELKQFIDVAGKAKSLEESATDDNYTWFGIASSIKDIEDFKKSYNDLLQAVEAGKDEKLGKGLSALWFTASDAKADLGEMQKKVISDIQNQINNLDLSKGKGELESFFKKMDEEMYKTSLDNIENLFPEQEWASVLNERLSALRDMYESWDEMSRDQAVNDINRQKEVNKQIRDNNTEGISDDYERQKEQLRNQLNDEIEAAQGNNELIISIKKKYQRLELDMEKQHNEKLKSEREAALDKEKSDREALNAILRQIRDNNLEAEEESLSKRIKALENARNDEIQDAKDKEKSAELILSINVKYDKLVEREKKKHYDYLNKLSEDYARRQLDIQQSILNDNLDNQSKQVDIEYNVKQNTSFGDYDFNAQYEEMIEEEKRYSKQRLDIELDYLKEKQRIEKEYANLDNLEAINNEQSQYEDRLNELKQFKEEGKLSEEDYNNFVEKENEQHSARLQLINKQLYDKLKSIEDDYTNNSKQKTSKSLTENVNLYSEYVRKVMDIVSDSNDHTNAFGIISYSKTKKDLEKALEVVRQGTDAIDNEISNLDNKLKNNEITFVDYKDARKQLESTKRELSSQAKDISSMLSSLFDTVASQWKGMLDGFVSQISSFLSTINDTKLMMIDNQIAEIEQLISIQEEAYRKAEEAAEAHKDKMDSIEDELSDARGSRRQFLIDTLAAQQAAYLEEVAAQQKAEKEKEKLEKKQEVLEKKRKEQEKKAKIQQAVINTYMAVSNALAVSPWFVGLALSAVALGLGMKNVAAIKSTPIYEDGGVIQGKRHSQGGVKVLGGQAEVEGGEFITNRKSTAYNLPLLTYINDRKREITPQELIEFLYKGTPKVKSKSTRFLENGGMIPTTMGADITKVINVNDTSEDNAVYQVQVVDIINATDNLKKVQVLSGLHNE